MFSIGRRRTSPPQVVPRENTPPRPQRSADVPAAEPVESEPTADHHAAARRLTAAQVPSIRSIRISPHGADAALVNISARGLLSECRVALRPGTKVTVIFSGGFSPESVSGRVARSAVARMAEDGIRYEVAVAFDEPLSLPDAAADPEAPVDEALDRKAAPAAAPARVAVNRW